MADPTEFLRLAVDPHRLAVLGAAAVGPVDSARLAASFGVPVKRVLAQVAKLRQAGLLDADGRLNFEELERVRRQLPDFEAAAREVTDGAWSAEEAAVLRTFFSGDRLAQIPAQQSKRRLVLERLVQEFEPGLRYDERYVNLKLQTFHPDYAALRRYMVDEGLLTRADGMYWRSGGRYDVDGR